MDLATKQAFFLFFAIHLPPVEEGEFLLTFVKIENRKHLECRPGVFVVVVLHEPTAIFYRLMAL